MEDTTRKRITRTPESFIEWVASMHPFVKTLIDIGDNPWSTIQGKIAAILENERTNSSAIWELLGQRRQIFLRINALDINHPAVAELKEYINSLPNPAPLYFAEKEEEAWAPTKKK